MQTAIQLERGNICALMASYHSTYAYLDWVFIITAFYFVCVCALYVSAYHLMNIKSSKNVCIDMNIVWLWTVCTHQFPTWTNNLRLWINVLQMEQKKWKSYERIFMTYGGLTRFFYVLFFMFIAAYCCTNLFIKMSVVGRNVTFPVAAARDEVLSDRSAEYNKKLK